MNNAFKGWGTVAKHLEAYAADQQAIEVDTGVAHLNAGQRASLGALAERLPNNGVVIADEVGMGKTRIAVEVVRAVIASGGRVAILVPPGLGYQWRDELRNGQVESLPIIRSLSNYFEAWRADKTSKRSVKLEPWFSLPLVVVSHRFSDWRLGERSGSWRWGLLPSIYALWKTQALEKPSPRGYYAHAETQEAYITDAAESIYRAVARKSRSTAYRLCSQMVEKTPWPAALDASEYGGNSDLRSQLECAVGLGLGIFDLIIVDEAHKSRGEETGLSRLLDSVIQRSPSARVIAMTATPVELEVGQWKNTLSRIGVDIESPPAMSNAIKAYADVVKNVRLCPSSMEIRQNYEKAATGFKNQLWPYLLRRDKREDPAVMAFAKHSGLAANNYRREQEITVETTALTPAWRQAVCAAEALSLVAQQGESSGAKRLRLTIGNGHGIANVLNTNTGTDASDVMQLQYEEAEQAEDEKKADAAKSAVTTETKDSKRLQRVDWWRKTMAQAFVGRDGGLFEHPALLACVNAIESATANDEKVLVFGRFTQPMRALVDLLNAREMLRCLQTGRSWPQAKIHETALNDGDKGEQPAVIAACRQLGFTLTLEEIDQALGRQYKDLENSRERWRNSLIAKLETELGVAPGHVQPNNLSKVQQLFVAFRESAKAAAAGDERHALALVGKAMLESMSEPEQATPAQIAEAFEQLINALMDRDEGDQDGDGVMNADEAEALWPMLEERLHEEYNRPQGGFARLMFGGTTPSARRMLQLAFNRPGSFPKVLVAQSMVGREGLNLHKACGTVILLHHEWNPGIVEQQIGRIDRVGSHWAKQLNTAIANKIDAKDLPRITVRPVIFKGTYDEHHWEVLRERWDDLRAQLHGVVIPPRLYANDPELQRLAEELEAVAPNFSPVGKGTADPITSS